MIELISNGRGNREINCGSGVAILDSPHFLSKEGGF